MHDDRHAMGRLFVRSVHGLARESYAPAQLEAWAPVSDDPPDWITRLESLECWLLELDGRLAGFIAWKPDGLLDLLFTDPEFARRGVASRLLSHMEQTARRQGWARIVTDASLVARPFFEARGFRQVRAERVKRRGQWLDRFRMEKTLLGGQEEHEAVTSC